MKLERIVLLLVWMALAASFIVWGVGGDSRQQLATWILVAGFGILCLPALLWVMHLLVRRKGDQRPARRQTL